MANKDPGEYDAIVIGAGFAGLYMLHRLRAMGLSAKVYEAGDGVGGTWYWNRYPGARCDVESLQYQYSFSEELQRGWDWSERYAAQPEILQYLNYVCDTLDLRGDIQFSTRVTAARYDELAQIWTVETTQDEYVSAKFCIMATGSLSAANVPAIPGIADFTGDVYHTGNWPHEAIDFTGKRVAVIGTGSSAIQAIPIIAETAAHLRVFQRTPSFTLPAFNRPLTRDELDRSRSNYAENRELSRQSASGIIFSRTDQPAKGLPLNEIHEHLERRWDMGGFAFTGTFTDVVIDKESNEIVADFVRGKIARLIDDPARAELLVPKGYPFATKRVCLDTGYFETFNLPHVQLIDVRSHPIAKITAGGIFVDGAEHATDVIIFATGFDAMTGALSRIDITGRNDVKLAEKWKAGPTTYLGLGISGFPNLFIIAGPGSPSVLTAVVLAIEQHVEWIEACVQHMRANGFTAIEADEPAERAWVDHVDALARQTLMPEADSWYMGANIPGKPQMFMPYIGGLHAYRKHCDEVAAAGYAGFTLSN